jgi:competence protein ComEC
LLAFIHDLRKVPVVRVALPFAAGIALCTKVPCNPNDSFIAIIACLLLLFLFCIHLFFPKNSPVCQLFFGISVIIILFILGTISGSLPSFHPSVNIHEEEGFIVGRVREVPVEKERSVMIHVEAVWFSSDTANTSMNENVQVYLPGNFVPTGMIPGTLWLFYGQMMIISNRGNPGEFNYASYMQRRGYRYNMFCSAAGCLDSEPALKYLPARVRQRIMTNWDRDNPAVAVLSAVTLGYRPLLDRQTKQAFSDAGAMHLLAVSGLHVGMVWWILDLLLKFPQHSVRWRYLKLSLILLFLWFYAAITGFSDSVTRSVTMFSIVALSKTMNRNSSIFNTLLLSGFLMLALKPSRLLEPGFQLSYLAVFGIITLQPLGARLYHSAHMLIKRTLDLVSVSIAAQTATLPLVLLYFNQFPVWFILTNLAAIPIVSLLLAAFVIFSPVLVIYPEWPFLSSVLLTVAGFLQWIIGTISSLPFAAIREISLHPSVAAGMMISIVLTYGFLIYRRICYLICLMSVLALTMVTSSCLSHRFGSTISFELYNFNHATVMSERTGLIRNTYIIGQDSQTDHFLTDYIQSLGRYPIALKQHHIVHLTVEDSVHHETLFRLSENLWAFSLARQDILLVGRCHSDELRFILESRRWDLVIFRTGFPRITQEHFRHLQGVKVIGDGTLREYEIASLVSALNEATTVKQTGAFEMMVNETFRSYPKMVRLLGTGKRY